MKPQFILAADAKFFDRTYLPGFLQKQPMDEGFATAIAPHLAIRQREALETDHSYRQLLPYVMVRQIGEDSRVRFFMYQRTSGVGEQRLAGKYSIGLGGHIDAADVRYGEEDSDRHNSIIDLLATLRDAASRELAEELTILNSDGSMRLRAPREAQFGNTLILHDEGVQIVHAGIVMFLDLPSSHSIKCAEEELLTVGFLTPYEILSKYGDSLEVWSRLYLESISGQ